MRKYKDKQIYLKSKKKRRKNKFISNFEYLYLYILTIYRKISKGKFGSFTNSFLKALLFYDNQWTIYLYINKLFKKKFFKLQENLIKINGRFYAYFILYLFLKINIIKKKI